MATEATSVVCANSRPFMRYETVHKSSDFLKDLKKKLKIKILEMSEELVEFELEGIDASLANTIRRVLLSETPTIAIEKVYIKNNTSIMQDEVLSHRLGLLPIRCDPDKLEYLGESGDGTHELNTLVFKMNVKCTEADLKNITVDPQDSTTCFKTIMSKCVKWEAQGKQKDIFKDDEPGMVHDDIVLNKLRPGQEIDIEAHAFKGIGSDHAKFSPVATAYYRMMPKVTLLRDVTGPDANILKDKCPNNVFDIEDTGKTIKAVVKNARNCTVCRECIREKSWEDRVELSRVRNHFIFSIESSGALPAKEIFLRAMKVLKNKYRNAKKDLKKAADLDTAMDTSV
jgi:DNA-directed RNA polymerases I and III subunit RPAC1